MSLLLLTEVNGTPGPKGSVSAFCTRCARRNLRPAVAIKEDSKVGAGFRLAVARQLKAGSFHGMISDRPYTGPVETRLIFYIQRRRAVRGGVETDQWLPSHSGPYPTYQKSGDIEKHVRTVHDALMDAGVILDDSQVWRVVAEKRWADEKNEPGVVIEIRTIETSGTQGVDAS